jgi:hypothetical protein
MARHRVHKCLAAASSRSGDTAVCFAALKALNEALVVPAGEAADERNSASRAAVEEDARYLLSFIEGTGDAGQTGVSAAGDLAVPAEDVEACVQADLAELLQTSVLHRGEATQGEIETRGGGEAAVSREMAEACTHQTVRESAGLVARETDKARRLLGAPAKEAFGTALTLLDKMSRTGGAWRAALCQCGAHGIVVSALRQHQNDGRHCAMLCSVLAWMSSNRQEQDALAAANAAPLLIDIYNDAVMGLDSSSARTMVDIATVMANMALGGSREALLSLGAEEALDAAEEDAAPLLTMKLAALVERMRREPHSALCQLHGCLRLIQLLDAPAAEEGLPARTAAQTERARREGVELPGTPPAPYAKGLLEAGVVKIAVDAIDYHAQTAAVLVAAMQLLSLLSAAEAGTVAFVESARGVPHVLAALQGALGPSPPSTDAATDNRKVLTAACGTLHHLAAAQAFLQASGTPSKVTVVNVASAGPLLLRASIAAQDSEPPAAVATQARSHADAALSWLSLDRYNWSSMLAALDADDDSRLSGAARAAMDTPLSSDLSRLAPAALVRLMRGHGSHDRLLQDGADVLRHAFEQGLLTPASVVELDIVPTIVDAVDAVMDGRNSLGSLMAMLSTLTSHRDTRRLVLQSNVTSRLVPLLAQAVDPPGDKRSLWALVLLHGCQILGDAMRQSAEDRVLRDRRGHAASEGDSLAVVERESAAPVAAALPALLHVLSKHGSDQSMAIGPCLGALKAISGTPAGAEALLSAGVLQLAVGLKTSWPPGASFKAVVDVFDVIRTLLCAAGCPVVTDSVDQQPDAPQTDGPGADILAALTSERPSLVTWVVAASSLTTTPNDSAMAGAKAGAVQIDTAAGPRDDVVDTPTLSMAATALLSTLLLWEVVATSHDDILSAPSNPDTETPPVALRPLLACMKEHRASEAVQLSGCSALAFCSRHARYQRPLARCGAVKTILFAMRTHIRSEDTQSFAVRALRHMSLGDDSCVEALVNANAIAMLAAVLRRHDAHLQVQSDGCACLGELVLRSAEGLAAAVKDKDATEALVGALRQCSMDERAFLRGQEALRGLAAVGPTFVKRIERANGSKFLCN